MAASVAVVSLLVVAAVLGKQILSFFNVGLDDFRISGGLLALVAATLWLAIPINRLLGATGINVATRVMALIVASVGINFILTGIKNQLLGLTR
jgi:small neutral amino acid transporter SnatA (MarC family)